MKIGYVRVSTQRQNVNRQIEKLKEFGCEEIFIDKRTGANFDREEYRKMKAMLRKKDIVAFAEFDRLGRNKEEIDKEWNEFIDRGIDIVVLNMPILDTRNNTEGLSKVMLGITKDILGYMAEQERINLLERQRQGIEIAKREGRYKGRPIKYSPQATGKDKLIYDTVIEKLKQGETVSQISRETDLSRNTIYKIKNKYEVEA
ncbi:recombinase [Sporosarcina sp. P20a]|uniref:recombinase family protein n=1 Tax=Sporosarcina sp. P20a TaxID=2048256 RepID=UPI000C16E857|nr:recombinase family protein [Sporosarcina sp. P20a]PIC85865.1 recombinase [Sporosarcina sp. P20a]